MPRYFEYDYDRGFAIEYERQGKCNHCGDCCAQALITLTKLNSSSAREGYPGTDQEGIWTAVQDDKGLWCFQVKAIRKQPNSCDGLTANFLCRLQFRQAKICRFWPMSPSHVAPFPKCSFRFQEVQRWPLESKAPSKTKEKP